MRITIATCVLVLGLWLLTGCSGNKAERLRQLEALEQQNRSGEPILNDSLAESLVDYFDRHGDANERMRSHYILGRTYYCLGELPRALEIYSEAADCADTTSADCDFAKLSRVYAQKESVYHRQVQPQSQLNCLHIAEYYAMKGRDTLMAVECYSLQADVYKLQGKWDSVICITEKAINRFNEIQRKDRASQIAGNIITTLVKRKRYKEASRCIDEYENLSGFFDKTGNIVKGREVYYYAKGEYYLSTYNLDSAECYFRKELRDGKDLNNQIAGCKGLQRLFELKRIPDSIAKYANLGYILNDSAYSLSEMQNIQKFQASYNYNHHKHLAEKKMREARNAYIAIAVIACFVVLISIIVFQLFRNIKKEKEIQSNLYLQTHDSLEKAQTELLELKESNVNAKSLIDRKSIEVEDLQNKLAELRSKAKSKEHANLEDVLENSIIVKELKNLLKANPVRPASQAQIREIKKLINEQIPVFYETLNSQSTLRPIEYEVSLLVRCHFKPAEICKLMDRDDGYISNLRRGILLKAYGIKGVPGDLDRRILQII